jgi:anti-sigma factor RsiW
MMSDACSAIQELLVDFADGQLSDAQHQRVVEHLATCPACEEELRLLRRSLELTLAAWHTSLPAAEELATNMSAANRARLPRHVVATACAVAGFLLLAGASTAWLIQRPSTGEPPILVVTHDVNSSPVSSTDDIDDFISRQTRTARLAEAVQLLASQPELEGYRLNAERYLKEVSDGIPRTP